MLRLDLTGGLGDRARELAVAGFASLWQGRALDVGAQPGLIAALVASGRCETDGEDLVGIHGLTLRLTRHRFVHDDVTHHTWCAFDAVAIPVALGLDAVASTTCRACGGGIEVVVRSGVPTGGSDLVLWLPDPNGEHLMDSFCAVADLYCSHEHLRQQVDAHASGRAVDLERAAAFGRETWSDVADLDLR